MITDIDSRTPRELWFYAGQVHASLKAAETWDDVETKTIIHVIEKSAYDQLTKRLGEMATDLSLTKAECEDRVGNIKLRLEQTKKHWADAIKQLTEARAETAKWKAACESADLRAFNSAMVERDQWREQAEKLAVALCKAKDMMPGGRDALDGGPTWPTQTVSKALADFEAFKKEQK